MLLHSDLWNWRSTPGVCGVRTHWAILLLLTPWEHQLRPHVLEGIFWHVLNLAGFSWCCFQSSSHWSCLSAAAFALLFLCVVWPAQLQCRGICPRGDLSQEGSVWICPEGDLSQGESAPQVLALGLQVSLHWDQCQHHTDWTWAELQISQESYFQWWLLWQFLELTHLQEL